MNYTPTFINYDEQMKQIYERLNIKRNLNIKKYKILADNVDLIFYYDEDNNIHISDIFDDNYSCAIIQIDKDSCIAYLLNLSADTNECFYHKFFILKNPGNFYITMIIKFLKKYKKELNINKIELSDTAMIDCFQDRINLSKFLLLTRGYTFYGKHNFIPKDKELKRLEDENIKILSKLKVKDVKFEKFVVNCLYGDIFLYNVKKNKNMSYFDFMSQYFSKDNEESCNLYYEIYEELEKYLIKNFRLNKIQTKFIRYLDL